MTTSHGGECQPGTFCPEASYAPTPCTPGTYCQTPGLDTPTGNCSEGQWFNTDWWFGSNRWKKKKEKKKKKRKRKGKRERGSESGSGRGIGRRRREGIVLIREWFWSLMNARCLVFL